MPEPWKHADICFVFFLSFAGIMRVTWRSIIVGFLATAAIALIRIRLEPDPESYYLAYPGNYKFIIENTATCESQSPFLVLMVPVAPGNSAARDAIRKTWGGETMVRGRRVITLFVLGLPSVVEQQQKLVQEDQQHHDLVQSDFLDSYHNLTIKTMMMLEWLNANCMDASYVMKIDSDMYLSVQNLVDLLVKPDTPKQDYMTGLVWWHSPVSRNILNKFYIPTTVVAAREFPPYPLGMSYVMSLDLPSKILEVAPHVRTFFIEDVYLGMCLSLLGIKPTDPPEEGMFLVYPTHPLSSCRLSKVIATTIDNIEQMTTYWQRSRYQDAKC